LGAEAPETQHTSAKGQAHTLHLRGRGGARNEGGGKPTQNEARAAARDGGGKKEGARGAIEAVEVPLRGVLTGRVGHFWRRRRRLRWRWHQWRRGRRGRPLFACRGRVGGHRRPYPACKRSPPAQRGKLGVGVALANGASPCHRPAATTKTMSTTGTYTSRMPRACQQHDCFYETRLKNTCEVIRVLRARHTMGATGHGLPLEASQALFLYMACGGSIARTTRAPIPVWANQ
jgi:hypothetical protein